METKYYRGHPRNTNDHRGLLWPTVGQPGRPRRKGHIPRITQPACPKSPRNRESELTDCWEDEGISDRNPPGRRKSSARWLPWRTLPNTRRRPGTNMPQTFPTHWRGRTLLATFPGQHHLATKARRGLHPVEHTCKIAPRNISELSSMYPATKGDLVQGRMAPASQCDAPRTCSRQRQHKADVRAGRCVC